MYNISKRKKYSSEFKAKVALCALKGEKTIAEISGYYGVHCSVIMKWKANLLKNAHRIFTISGSDNKDSNNNINILHAKIGELIIERDFLKKNLQML